MVNISFGPFELGLNKSVSKTAKALNSLDDAYNALIDPIGNISSAYESFQFIQFPGPVFDVPTRIIFWPEKDIYVRLNGKARDGSNNIVFEAGKGFIQTSIGSNESTATIYEELLVIAEDADIDFPVKVYGTDAENGRFVPVSENFKKDGTITDVTGNTITGSGTSFDSSDIDKRFFFDISGRTPSILTVSYKIVAVNSATEIVVSDGNVANDLTTAGLDPGSPPAQYRIALDGFRGISPEFFQGRLFFIDGENRTAIVHTGFPGDDESPPQLFDFSFIDSLTRIELGNSFGNLIALKAAGNALYAIAERGAFIITGTPPVNAALGSNLRPEPLTKSVGAKVYDCVAVTRDGQGLLLSSEAGFWTLYGTRSTRIDDTFRGHEYFDPRLVTHVASDQRRVYFSISTHDWRRALVGFKRVTAQEPLSFFLDQRQGSASIIQRIQSKDGKIELMALAGFGSAILQANSTRSTEVFVSSDRRVTRINFDNEPEDRKEYGVSFITTHSNGKSPFPKRIWKTHIQVENPGFEDLSIIAPAAGKSGITATEEVTIKRTSFDADTSRYTAFNRCMGKGTSEISVGVGHFSDIIYGGTTVDDIRDTLSAVATAADDWYISPFFFQCDNKRKSTFIERIDFLVQSNDVLVDLDGTELSIIADDGTTVSLLQKASIQVISGQTRFFTTELIWISAYITPVVFDNSVVQYYAGIRWDSSTVDLPLEFGNGEQVNTFNETTGITGTIGPINRRLKFRGVRQLGRPFFCRNLSMVVADVESRPGIQI